MTRTNGVNEMSNMQQIIEMLNQIAKNTTSHDEVWIAIITAIAAISGTIIGAFLTYYSSKQQSKTQLIISEKELIANTITKQRLEWLTIIRKDAGDVIADFEMLYSLIKRPSISQTQIDPLFESSMRKSNSITFMLNRDKNNQKDIMDAIWDLQEILRSSSNLRNQQQPINSDLAFQAAKEKLISGLWSVGKETWNKIKELR